MKTVCKQNFFSAAGDVLRRPSQRFVRSDGGGAGAAGNKVIVGLLSNIAAATRIAKAAKACHLGVRNFDRADPLLAFVGQAAPAMMILDWDGCEAAAFSVCQELCRQGISSSFPVIGFVSQNKAALREEAQRAGCDRVYFKTEFMQQLEVLLARCAV